jgi:hypothetical protein
MAVSATIRANLALVSSDSLRASLMEENTVRAFRVIVAEGRIPLMRKRRSGMAVNSEECEGIATTSLVGDVRRRAAGDRWLCLGRCRRGVGRYGGDER